MQHKNLRGADLHSPSSELIENNTGSTIPVLTAVTFNGMGSLYPQIRPADSTVDTIRGITQASISTGTTGYITSLGFLNGINTSAWPVNTVLYANTSGVVTTATIGLPIAVVLAQDAMNGIIYVNSWGITESILNNLQFPTALSLELAWNISYASNYGEPTYVGNQITQYNIWDSSAKAIHIFNKTYTYTGINVTQVVVTSILGGQTLTKNITYNGSNQVTSVTRVYTP